MPHPRTFIQRQYFLLPDPLIHVAGVAIADNPLAVDKEGLRRAVHPEIQPQHAVAVVQAEGIGIAEGIEPGHRLGAIVFIVQANHPHAARRQRIEILVFRAAGRAPGGPDVEQDRLAVAQHRLIVGFAGLIQRFQPEGRHRFADQRRLQHGRIFAAGVARQLHHQRRHQQQEEDQRDKQQFTLHGCASSLPSRLSFLLMR
jgi:hypothetical protein